ncbi:MAG: TIGR02147 family protein [Fibrobacteres bacterium]|nr:TIGR02147 family protein [Fibrobacterota bacterium]
MPDVLGYLDYRVYLKDWYDARKRRERGFSYRVLAREVGYRSHAFFSLVLQRRSNISMEVAMGFADCIGLKAKEREYFLLLVSCNQEDLPSQRSIMFQRLQDLNGTPATRLREDQNAFLASWRHAALREMLGIDPFQGGEAQWGERMVPAATAQEVRDSLDLLLALGLAHRTARGIVRTDPRLVTGTAYTESATRGFMRQVHELGGEAMERFPRSERHHGWATLSVSAETLETMQAELRALVQRFLTLAEKDDSPDRVMQLNLELFPLGYGRKDS